MKFTRHVVLLIALGLMTWMSNLHAATFSVVNLDSPGTGLNDTTAFTPVGGNNATTLGQARLNVIAEAGRIWGQQLTSTQVIVMEAQFSSQTCTNTSATLASAGPTVFFSLSNQPNVLLPAALADATNGQNNGNENDISITINSALGSGPSCLGGRSFYLGLDHNNGMNVDLLNVLLHELGHGLGFISLTNSSGAPIVSGKFSAFEQFIYAEALGKFWPNMTNTERANAAISVNALAFNGTAVNAHLNGFSIGTGLSNPGGHLRLYAPSTYADGSSVSHWDTVATPDLLMEPFIHANPSGLTDMTGCVLRDIGWSNARCPDNGIANTPPAAQAQSVTTNEDTAASLTLLAIDADSSSALTYSIVTQPAHGTLTLPGSMTSNSGISVTYTPTANYNGADSFTFQASDGTDLSAPATVTLTITAVNDAPQAQSQTLSTAANTVLNITLSGTDIEGSTLTYVVATSPTHGSLSGTAPHLTYIPTTDFAGTDSLTFTVNDGSLNSTAASITITVTPPVANATQASSSGGGGAWQWPVLLCLTALQFMRRKFSLRLVRA